MRRNKAKHDAVKVLTTAAAIAAITTGSVSAYASNFDGYNWIRVGGQQISIAALEDNPEFRERVIESFLNAETATVSIDGQLFEKGHHSTADSILTPFFEAPTVRDSVVARRLARTLRSRVIRRGQEEANLTPDGVLEDNIWWLPYEM